MTPEDYLTGAQLVGLVREGTLSMEDEVFTYDIPGLGRLVWNVTQARAMPGGLEGVLPLEVVEETVRRYHYEEARVEEVDVAIPGLVAAFWDPLEGRGCLALIDGTHRCVQAYRQRVPFVVRCLTVAASYACLLIAPLAVWQGQEACAQIGPYGVEDLGKEVSC